MTALVVRADARELPLPDESVDVIVTSPPYFALRSYRDGGDVLDGQIGAEDNPQAYLKALWTATSEWTRVLKPTGSLFVNLGDKFGRGARYTTQGKATHGRGLADREAVPAAGPEKGLLGLPWRYALGCVDDLGLLLREEIIWDKPNGLPESVRDRCARTHEQWFHLTRQPRYYAAIDELREPHTDDSVRRLTRAWNVRRRTERYDGQKGHTFRQDQSLHPLGRLPGSVWRIPTRPLVPPPSLGIEHFAAFPVDWPVRLVTGWCPPAICETCGEGLRPVVDRTPMVWRESPTIDGRWRPNGDTRKPLSGTMLAPATVVIRGYECDCAELGTVRPAVVLDPFGGTGSTALAASVLGRVGISADLSHDYGRMARWRTADPKERALALGFDAPPVQADGQEALPL